MAKKARGFTSYDTYKFTDQDPVVDSVRTAIKDTKMAVSDITAKSRVATTTIHNWLNQKTKRPQFATVAAVMGAMGKKVDWVDSGRRRAAA